MMTCQFCSNEQPQCSSEYVREYRKLTKECRELEYRVRDEEHKAHMAAEARGRLIHFFQVYVTDYKSFFDSKNFFLRMSRNLTVQGNEVP